MGLFSKDDTPAFVGPVPPALTSLEALAAAPLHELAAAILLAGLRDEQPTTTDPASAAGVVLKVADVLAEQPGETRRASQLVPELQLLVAEGIQVLERALLVRTLQRGSTDLALHLTRRGRAALDGGDLTAVLPPV